MIFLLKYGKYIASAIAIVIYSYIVYSIGVNSEKVNHQKTIMQYKDEVINLKNNQIKEQNELLGKYNDASKAFEIDMSNLKTKEKFFNKEILKEVQIPVYSECKITENAFNKLNEKIDEANGVKK